MEELSIIQYNYGNANNGRAKAFFDAIDPRVHQVAAIQEPA